MKPCFANQAVALMSDASLASLAVATPVASRQATPARHGGFIAQCDFYQVTSHGEAYGHLQATCNTDPGNPATEVASTLDLSLCLGNYNNNLAWGYMGGAFASCQGCTSRMFNTRYLDCDCGSVDLNDGIYMTESGAVACYDNVGSSYSVPYRD
ncbi:hypothetical protein HMPREF1624_02188 [Sporothrix schenckii ATCC 58251]|uniref:Cyanovirin-N domain-containing protein n=1 Tax=Sporothrix schenckii (strain ATCC 58251 / de Perez 2211183) TaxID=1391915 RepID=U7PZE5_SPOS1|nr:hypothetical protein HMPREF1624_02188 [Sporothrix schenckii ATCC 58251]